MSYLHCPVCALNVPRTPESQVGAEACPRCLAQSSGAISVKLARGRAPASTPVVRRVTASLNELRPSVAKR
jgi:Zn-finger nucleic acid-binding protein